MEVGRHHVFRELQAVDHLVTRKREPKDGPVPVAFHQLQSPARAGPLPPAFTSSASSRRNIISTCWSVQDSLLHCVESTRVQRPNGGSLSPRPSVNGGSRELDEMFSSAAGSLRKASACRHAGLSACAWGFRKTATRQNTSSPDRLGQLSWSKHPICQRPYLVQGLDQMSSTTPTPEPRTEPATFTSVCRALVGPSVYRPINRQRSAVALCCCFLFSIPQSWRRRSRQGRKVVSRKHHVHGGTREQEHQYHLTRTAQS